MLKTLSRLLPKRTPKPAKLVEALASQTVDPMEASLQALGRSRKAQVAPALLLATGAGVAFWWWTQWARGAEESEAAAKSVRDERRDPPTQA